MLTKMLFLTLAAASAISMPAQQVQADSVTQPASLAAADEVSRLVYVISPWGFGAWYCVHRGCNTLICTGTGLAFRYFSRC